MTGSRKLAAALAAAVVLAGAPAATAKEALVEQVRTAIDRGVQFLRDQQHVTADGQGNWEVSEESVFYKGGYTALAMLALINAGVKPDDPLIQRGLEYLRTIPPEKTYVVSLQTMVFAAVGSNLDPQRIQTNVDWLVQAWKNGGRRGWSYFQNTKMTADNSNTQFALLGLHEARQAGAKIDREVWEGIQAYYKGTQLFGGGWAYRDTGDAERAGFNRDEAARLTMTTAGLCGLILSGQDLNESREKIQPNGVALHCGEYQDSDHVAKAVRWIGRHFAFQVTGASGPVTYYNLYGIERAGRLSGLRFFGGHDWYREGCEFLVKRQNRLDGSWHESGGAGNAPLVNTSFALLFLSKGRVPVLVSKLAYGRGADWNNDRNDARHLVEFVSREMFKKLPLAWQVFEPKRAPTEDTRELLADLLQSPVLYFNGHESPLRALTDQEVALLKAYVEQGGFVLAEACCNSEEFDQGFRELVKRLFPDRQDALQPLRVDHPVWTSYFHVNPTLADRYKLQGVEMGCKTVVVYSPQDLSCRWEEDHFDTPEGRPAFELGANIIAYATGLEAPKPRLTQAEVIEEPAEKKIPRGFLKVVQLRHDGDWQPAPQAMHNLMAYLRDKTRLDVAVQTEALAPSNPGVLDFKFLYMHGRAAFSYGRGSNNPALDNLRSDLQTGGLLLADACCGKAEFDRAFREFVAQLFPERKLERIPLNDELFSEELNGEAIQTVRCRRERPDGMGAEAEMHDVPPYLEGIKINNRWAVIYSKYDLGCALERHQSSDCLGHDFASAVRLGTAAVLYAMKR